MSAKNRMCINAVMYRMDYKKLLTKWHCEQLFENARSLPLSEAAAVTPIAIRSSKFTFSKNMGSLPHLWSNNNMMGRNLKCENNNKWGPKMRLMMKKFPIWLQNLNRISFYPLCPKHDRNRQNTWFSQFLTVFGNKGNFAFHLKFWDQIRNPLIT